MNLFIFRRRHRDRHAIPQPHPVTVPVNVTAAERQRPVIDHGQGEGMEWAKPDAATVAHIDAHLPNRPISDNLKACRFAAVLDREAAFLADKTGTVEPPERWEVIAACVAGAEALRDQVVIA